MVTCFWKPLYLKVRYKKERPWYDHFCLMANWTGVKSEKECRFIVDCAQEKN